MLIESLHVAWYLMALAMLALSVIILDIFSRTVHDIDLDLLSYSCCSVSHFSSHNIFLSLTLLALNWHYSAGIPFATHSFLLSVRNEFNISSLLISDIMSRASLYGVATTNKSIMR